MPLIDTVTLGSCRTRGRRPHHARHDTPPELGCVAQGGVCRARRDTTLRSVGCRPTGPHIAPGAPRRSARVGAGVDPGARIARRYDAATRGRVARGAHAAPHARGLPRRPVVSHKAAHAAPHPTRHPGGACDAQDPSPCTRTMSRQPELPPRPSALHRHAPQRPAPRHAPQRPPPRHAPQRPPPRHGSTARSQATAPPRSPQARHRALHRHAPQRPPPGTAPRVRWHSPTALSPRHAPQPPPPGTAPQPPPNDSRQATG
jgi:hypothetical protein